MQSAKVIMMLWVKCKMSVNSVIKLDPEDADDIQDTENNMRDNQIKVETSFNSLMTMSFEDNNIEE